MAKLVFLDTNGWLALLNEDDSWHPHARELWVRLARERCSFVLTDWIIAETGNGLARTPRRRWFPPAARELLSSPQVKLVVASSVLMQRALDLYEARPDKAWGLVDCASFVVMSEERIAEAFTTDRHFEQAGFTCLLATPAS